MSADAGACSTPPPTSPDGSRTVTGRGADADADSAGAALVDPPSPFRGPRVFGLSPGCGVRAASFPEPRALAPPPSRYSAAFSFAAAAFFPALTLGIFWKRANRWGAVVGMAGGLGLTFY